MSKSKCPTFLRSKGKAMAVILSDDEVFDHESGSDDDRNFIAFTATAIADESVVIDENPFDGELSENANLQEPYNKLCKVAAKDDMSVDLDLKKIASLELDKKILLLKFFDANELIDKVKTENMLLLDKIKNLEFELSVVKEQTNRSISSKFEHMLSIQKSPLDKTGLGFEDSIFMHKTHSTNFVSSSEPPVSEIVKLIEVTLPRKTRVDLKESKPKNSTIPKDKLHDRPKVHVSQAQDPMVLIGELVKVLNLYTNHGVAHHSIMKNNSNARVASKKFWMQKAQSK